MHDMITLWRELGWRSEAAMPFVLFLKTMLLLDETYLEWYQEKHPPIDEASTDDTRTYYSGE